MFGEGAALIMSPSESTTVPFGRVKYLLMPVAVAVTRLVVACEESESVAWLIAC